MTNAKDQRIIALLGRRDEPTDAVEEYCRYLGDALRAHGFRMDLVRVPWPEQGWSAVLKQLRQDARDWRGQWVFLQYTALAWSSRGFPQKFLRVVNTLQKAGARVGVVYHDVEPYYGKRVIDRVRRSFQLRTMQRALSRADLAVFTVGLDTISWLKSKHRNATFIPVAANLPISAFPVGNTDLRTRTLRIAVFGFSGGEAGMWESQRITQAVRFAAKVRKLQLYAFGRNAKQFEGALREGLRDVPVEVCVEGILSPDRVATELSSSDVMLFVRGAISTRRGSAIAGIACGLPIVAYRGHDTAPPVTEAGLVLVTWENPDDLGQALVQVVTNNQFRKQLAEASSRAQSRYFSWAAVAARYAEELQKHSGPPEQS